MQRFQGPVTLAARVLIALIFISSGVTKIVDPAGPMEFLAGRGLPSPGFLVWCAIVAEIGGGALILVGYRARLGAGALCLFLVAATVLYHDFWRFSDEVLRQRHTAGFLKNLAILGTLMLVLAQGAGRMSFDNARSGERAQYW